MKILLVDDDPATLLVTSLALRDAGGFEVIIANGGVDAVDQARQSCPDAILMDLLMYDLDGPEVLQRLRCCTETRNIPIIFHTAKTGPGQSDKLLALGAKGVIEKPFNPVHLAAEIHRVLSQAPR